MRTAAMTLVCAACAALTTGCFTREESIVVRPDGSASITYQVEGDAGEIESGDALPSRLGWASEQTTKNDSSGGTTVTTTWRRDLPDLNRYPASFAAPDDPHASAYLHTTTRLEIAQQPGRTVYRFTRTYVGRRSGMYAAMRNALLPQDLMKKAEEDEASLTPEERDKVFDALAEYEAAAMLLRARNGLGRATTAGVLDARSFGSTVEELARHLADRLTGEYLRRFMGLSQEEQDRAERDLKDGFRAAIERLVPADARGEAMFYVDGEEKAFEVTQDLNDESFSLAVQLPGTIVYANTWMLQGSGAEWDFSGEDLAEGDLVLTAVSVVEHDAAGR